MSINKLYPISKPIKNTSSLACQNYMRNIKSNQDKLKLQFELNSVNIRLNTLKHNTKLIVNTLEQMQQERAIQYGTSITQNEKMNNYDDIARKLSYTEKEEELFQSKETCDKETYEELTEKATLKKETNVFELFSRPIEGPSLEYLQSIKQCEEIRIRVKESEERMNQEMCSSFNTMPISDPYYFANAQITGLTFDNGLERNSNNCFFPNGFLAPISENFPTQNPFDSFTMQTQHNSNPFCQMVNPITNNWNNSGTPTFFPLENKSAQCAAINPFASNQFSSTQNNIFATNPFSAQSNDNTFSGNIATTPNNSPFNFGCSEQPNACKNPFSSFTFGQGTEQKVLPNSLSQPQQINPFINKMQDKEMPTSLQCNPFENVDKLLSQYDPMVGGNHDQPSQANNPFQSLNFSNDSMNSTSAIALGYTERKTERIINPFDVSIASESSIQNTTLNDIFNSKKELKQDDPFLKYINPTKSDASFSFSN